MNLYVVLFLCFSTSMANKTASTRHKSVAVSSRSNAIVIPVMVYLDFKLTKKIAKEHSFKTRKKIKGIVNSILNDTNTLFRRPTLDRTITLKLLDTKFYRNTNVMGMDENASNYLKSFCERQSRQKVIKKKFYYSILLTGLDLFYVKSGKAVRSTTGRSYTNGVCNLKKSCSLIEWDPKNMGYLLAHEIGHSLGMRHDGRPHNNCEGFKGIMTPKYNPENHPNIWSPCSRISFENFLRNEKSSCLRDRAAQPLKYT